MFKISPEGIALIKRFEGLRLEAYYDDVGVLTIGWGHTVRDVFEGQVITEAEAEALLAKDLQRFESGVNGAVKVRITQSMFDALVSFSYNVGVSAMKGSTALKRLNKGDYEGAAEALTWWNKGRVNGELVVLRGLSIRRSAEAALFLRDLDQVDAENDDARSLAGVEVKENPPRRNNPITTRTTGGAATSGAAGAGAAGAVLMDDEEGGESGNDGDDDTADMPAETDEPTADTPTDPTPTEDDAPAEEPTEQPEPVEDAADDAPTADAVTEVPADTAPDEPDKQDYTDAIVVALGVLAVLAAIYVIAARIDDWFKYRR